MRKRLCLSLVAGIAAVFASTAAADPGMAIGLGAPNLYSRVAITEPVTLSCSPFDPLLTLINERVTVSVEQAAGKAIAHGSGSVFGSINSTLPFPCDGVAHTVSVNVVADPGGPPFHGGPAVYSAIADAQAGTPCFPGSTNCFFIVADEAGNIGPTTVTMH